MIINMAVDNNGSNNQTLTVLNSTANQQEQYAFNFLKRKHDDATEDIQEIDNQIGNENLTTHYQGSNELGNHLWKKRHIEQTTVTTITTTATISTTTATTNLISNATTNCFNLNHNLINNDNQINEANYNNNIINNNNSNNNNNNHNNDITFNLISSSAFINDFFEYDAGLIVPVTISADVQQQQSQQLSTNNIVPTIINSTNVYDDGHDWQSTDLLELDHRYNSGLQTEIAQITPTINIRSPIHTNNSNNPLQSVIPISTQLNLSLSTNSSELQNSNLSGDFLVPLKTSNQHSTPTTLTKYRSVQNLTQLENNQKADTETDFEDKNLSWLLNFKFDDLPHLSPDVSANKSNNPNSASARKSSSTIENSISNSHTSNTQRDRSRSPKTSATKTGKKFEELVMEVTAELDGNEMIVAENVVVEDTPLKTLKKPPFTYTELIEYALEDKGELTVSGIYQWISDRFPYYKSNDDRWKNSVRHNLSINPHFRKGVKAPQGAGHLWTISSGDSAENVLAWEHKKQRLELFFKMESMNRERLQQHQQQQLQLQRNGQCASPDNHQNCQDGHCLYEETAKATATISQEMLQQQQQQRTDTTETSNEHHHQRLTNSQIMHELPFNDLMSDEELRKTAGQILNGIHREVEVQSVNSMISTYHDVLLDNEDYLNPIQKDVAVHESGLRHTTSNHINSQHSHHNSSQYYVTEIDPLELGIQMSHQVHEEEVLFNDDFNLNLFGYNAGNDIVA